MTYTVTANDFEVRNGDLYYTGPLDEAKRFVQKFHGTSEHVVTLKDGVTTVHQVLIAYGTDTPTIEDAAEWGNGPTPEDAWRWVLGAVFGPLDNEFQPVELSVCAEFDENGSCIHSDHTN
jgi:hypothetical protein